MEKIYGWIAIAVLVLVFALVLSFLISTYTKTPAPETEKEPTNVHEGTQNEKKSAFEINDMADNGAFELDTFTATSDNKWYNKSPTPTITSEAYNTLGHSLKCFGNTNLQKYTKQWFKADEYYIACKIRVDRYVQGYAGVLVNHGGNENVPVIQVTETTNNEFITASGTFKTDGAINFNLFYGTFDDADLDCYIDDIVIVPLSVFNEKPSVEELNAQYEKYVSTRTVKDTIDEVAVFMEKVNEKAAALGMKNSIFATPSGINPYGKYDDLRAHRSTAEDIMKLTLAAYQNDTLRVFWSAATKDVSIDGPSERTITLNSTYIGNKKTKYTILGGKTGTIANTSNITTITEINGKTVIGVIMGAENDDARYAALDELLDICTNVLSDSSYDASEVTITNATSAIACVLTEDGYDILFEQKKTKRHTPASVTKVISLLTALDYVDNLDAEIDIIHNDVTPGSGPAYAQGDIITFEEAFYSMMLPSSNTASTAVARNVGAIIINN